MSDQARSAAEALRAAVRHLRAAGVPDAPGDARVLLADAMGLGPDRLTLHLPDPLDPAAEARLAAHLTARAARQPVSQIVGRRLFWGMEFIVTPQVLDPRPETEVLVAAAISRPFVKLLDLGTGSGAILLACLTAMPMATGLGVDLSPGALAVARRNAVALGLEGRARLGLSDWFAAVPGRYDLIVSNPPYIAADEMPALEPEVRLHEPHIALSPGGDGLGAYRQITAGAMARLMPGGRILLEIGPTQGAAVRAMLAAQGFERCALLPDLDGRDRVAMAYAPGGDQGCGSV
ncbi:MAG: peptide chain release factor N(5)-glutamine methyltransferase [Paracoccaceae bacterium]